MKINKLLDKLSIDYRNLAPYELALVHPSYQNEHGLEDNNQRYEFLGDAVVELIVSNYLFNELSSPEGELTRMRASLVREETLARLARKLNLQAYLLLGKGEELIGGRRRDSNLADCFEAFMGALYRDLGYIRAQEFFLENFLDEIKEIRGGQALKDYKSELQILCQSQGKSLAYKLVEATGPDHEKSFLVACCIDGRVKGQGRGSSKRQAEQEAAREALGEL